jgi:ankyrin repeat protein
MLLIIMDIMLFILVIVYIQKMIKILNFSFFYFLTASQYRYKEIVQLLIETGADINAKNNHGDTPLHCGNHSLSIHRINQIFVF